MKKLFLLSLTFLLVLTSCSSSDDNENNSNTSINPPSWIQGTWSIVQSTDPLTTQPLFRFKSNDFCTLALSMEGCYAENLKLSLQSGVKTEVKEKSTDSEYEIAMTIQSVTTTYKFIKVSNTKIKYINPTNGLPDTELIKQ